MTLASFPERRPAVTFSALVLAFSWGVRIPTPAVLPDGRTVPSTTDADARPPTRRPETEVLDA